MATNQIKIEGLDEMKAILRVAAAQARKAAAEATSQEVGLVEHDARMGAPIDEGVLMDSIVGRSSGSYGEVRAGARHGLFVEYGTYKDPVQPFMWPAAERSRARFPTKAAARMGMALRRVKR